LVIFGASCQTSSRLLVEEKAAREEAEEEAELVRLSEGWSRAKAVQLERDLMIF